MYSPDREKIEGILRQLEDGGHMFRGLMLSMENGSPMMLGTGGSAYVYGLERDDGGSDKYALKVMVYGCDAAASPEYSDTCKIQWALARESDYIVDVLDNKMLTLHIDAEGNLIGAEEYDGKTALLGDALIIQFILMERLTPVVLKNRFHKVYISRESLCEEAEVIRFALQIGSALAAAHSFSVLHRDIKLENIFWDEEKGVYKLGDFGVARQTADGNAETVVFTGGYGAPEIVTHSVKSYGAAADIYSLGMTMYLLLNDLIFPGSDGYYSRTEIQYAPETVFAAPKHASPGMAALIRKMCSYRPSDRYRSVTEVLQELLLLQEREGREASDEMPDIADILTETYCEEKEEKDGPEVEELPLTRAGRKKEKELKDSFYRGEIIKYTLLFSFLILLFLSGAGAGWKDINSLLLLALPFLMLLNAIFRILKDLNLLAGVATLLFILYSVQHTGLSAPYMTAALCVLSGSSVLCLSCSIAMVLWILTGSVTELAFIQDIGKFGMADIAFAAGVVFIYEYSLTEYYCERIREKTAEIILYLLDKLHIMLLIGGTVLWVLKLRGILILPDALSGLHPVVTGIAVGAILTVKYKIDELDYYSMWCNVFWKTRGA